MIPKFRLYDPSDQKIREVAEIDWPLGIVVVVERLNTN